MEPQVKYLLSLGAIRERAKLVGNASKTGKLTHFDLHEEKLGDAVDFVVSVIKVREFEDNWGDSRGSDFCYSYDSGASARTSLIRSLPTDAGSISKSEMYRALQT